MLGKEEISVSIVDRLLVEQIDQRGQVELLRTYFKEYLLSLQQLRETYVWMTSVIIKDDNAPRNRWQLARIVTAN